jgi:S1-C subfamily serine protease
MTSMTRRLYVFLALAVALAAAPAFAQDADKPPRDPAAQAKLAEATAPSLVRVEYTLQYDKGEAPTSAGWSTRCPTCGQFHGSDVSSVVQEDRPYETGGFLVGADEVITADPMIHPRFVKRIAVTFGGTTVEAAPARYATRHNALTLKLAGPLDGAKPLAFDGGKAGPYSAVTYTQENGDWTVAVQPLGGTVATTSQGRRFAAAASPAVVVAEDGTPVALSMNGELPLDGSWKGAPADWPSLSAEELAAVTQSVRKAAGGGLLRVTLNFRSPRATPMQQMMSRRNDEDNATVQHVTGVLLDERTVLVLAELKSNTTSRLEKIRVRAAEGPAAEARFAHTLADYGAFVATLDQPLPGALAAPAAGDVREARGVLLPAVQVLVQGEKRTEYYAHRRISGFGTGFRRQLYPEVPGDNAGVFLFDGAGALVALPVTRRTTVSLQERWGNENQPVLTPVSYLRQVAKDLPRGADAGNVPLSENEENRLAWLGVELQGLNPELARANDVSHLTNDGQSGALVTHVYAGSPAADAGVEPGWILIRAHVEGEPKPLEVTVEPHVFADQAFPWDRYDELPEQVFDRIPQPWPPAENTLTRALTDIGFGRAFTAEFFHDGKVEEKSFKVTQSPAHYESAPKFKLDSLGVTVRDLTYEVRRYFQREVDEPGVLISKIEMGSKASTSGLKPFEMVTHVNDQPVNTVQDFERLTKDQQELRLSIRRMAKGRQVKVKLAAKDAPKPAPVEEQPQTEEPDAGEDANAEPAAAPEESEGAEAPAGDRE